MTFQWPVGMRQSEMLLCCVQAELLNFANATSKDTPVRFSDVSLEVACARESGHLQGQLAMPAKGRVILMRIGLVSFDSVFAREALSADSAKPDPLGFGNVLLHVEPEVAFSGEGGHALVARELDL